METQVKEMYARIVGNSPTYTLETVLKDYDTILWMNHNDEAAALHEIEYVMNFFMGNK